MKAPIMPNVSLGPHFDRFIQEQVESGRFQDASEVVRAGLRLLEEHETFHAERLAELKRQINEAFDDPRPSIPAEEVLDGLRRKHEERMKARPDGA
jgi:antitoxin ParD1/3/4